MNLQSEITDHFRTTLPQKKALKRLGLESIRDLLYYFPVRYSGSSEIKQIKQLEHDDLVSVFGVVDNLQIKKTFQKGTPSTQATLEDVNGDSIKLIWFHQAYIAKTLTNGQALKITGKVSVNKSGVSIINPEYEVVNEIPNASDSLFSNESDEKQSFGYPVYRESRGVSSKWIYHTILKILQSELMEQLEDPLPVYIRDKYHLPSLTTALVWLHAPQKRNDATSAQKRFAFEEIFFIQLRNYQRRKEHAAKHSYLLEIDDTATQKFIDRFPFTPTDAQRQALEAILGDMKSPAPMSRLLEGDVGSGKTFVAAVAAFAAVSNRPKKQNFGRLQVAYMAPTEVLATQLFENFIEYFKGSGIQIGLITGSGCRKFPSKIQSEAWTNISGPQLRKWVANGEIPILIGTHALIQKKVTFKDLALAIIDEQHRFGTKQRMKLGNKDDRIPHYLSMTATPIPRTLALTIYGDLDLSVIDHMPEGRKEVKTEIVATDERSAVYDALRERLEEGRQAYVICPRIDEADPSRAGGLQLKSVIAEAKRLQETEFKNYTVGIMHSKMKKNEKEEVMEQFYNHEIDVLVSTSVVEVGVNVPNATSIIIEGAERFGLAQLHQLRGRVIRSEHQAYCYLFADAKSKKTTERLDAIVNAKNGFELAEIDLSIRGAGDLAGVKQWGMSDLAMEAIRNIKMVEYARKEAQEIIENDEALENFPELQKIINQDHYHIHFE